VSPAQAQDVSPQAVEVIAKKAQQANPSIVDAASDFYAKNPQLVKAIGAGALAMLMSRLSKQRA
jgi:ABC-type spermidine/putrescine transport system permease subunit II